MELQVRKICLNGVSQEDVDLIGQSQEEAPIARMNGIAGITERTYSG